MSHQYNYYHVTDLYLGMQCTHWLRKDWGVGTVLEIAVRTRAGYNLLIRWDDNSESWHKMQELRKPAATRLIVRPTCRKVPGFTR